MRANQISSDIFDLNEEIKDDSIVKLINILSDSIKEYYKVNKNINKNESILVNSCKNEINNSKLIINSILKEGITNNKINSYNAVINKLGDILHNLQLNINSNEKNLGSFFEDAKILFKKIKEQRHTFLLKIQKRVNSNSYSHGKHNLEKIPNFVSHNYNSDIRRIYSTTPNERSNNLYQNSSNKQKINNFIYNNLNINNNNIIDDNNRKKSRSQSNNREENKEEIDKGINISNIVNNEKKEIERLSKLVKQYEAHIKKLNLEIKKYKIQNNNNYVNNNNNNNNNLNVLNQKGNENKDKIILSLKNNIRMNNIKYNKLITNYNNCQNIIKKLKDENNKLKGNFLPLSNNNESYNSEKNKKLFNQMNKLLKENNILKNQIVNNKTNSDYHYNINVKDVNIGKINSYEKEIELLKQNLSSVKKQLLDEQKKYKELVNENILLKKNEFELSKVDKNNNNLEENINSVNEKYIKENEELKKQNDDFQEKIKYYKTQIKKIKNELYEKMQANIELHINNDKKISDMKNECDKKNEEIINKNKNLETTLEECQKFSNDLIQQINDLNQQIIAKDIKILELNYKIEKTEKNLSN